MVAVRGNGCVVTPVPGGDRGPRTCSAPGDGEVPGSQTTIHAFSPDFADSEFLKRVNWAYRRLNGIYWKSYSWDK